VEFDVISVLLVDKFVW